METMRTISYDFEAAGRKIVPIPSEMPFSGMFEGLKTIRLDCPRTSS
jgi:hypothetical protein